MCKQFVCSNELCQIKFTVDGVGMSSRIKFAIDNIEYVSCSKKCQKVTKFSLVLRRND
jgi:hypothetical protein